MAMLMGCTVMLIMANAPASRAQVIPGNGRQAIPNAGQLLRDVAPPSIPASPKSYKGIELPASSGAASGPAAATIIPLRKIRIEGNARISTEQLQRDFAELSHPGKNVTLGQLQELASKITNYYRAQGFIVAYAFLPPQTVENQTVTIRVLEGQVSQVGIGTSAGYRPEIIQRYAERQLCPTGEAGCGGEVLTKDRADRALGLINDLPGVASTTVTLSPGTETGSSKLVFDVKAGKSYIVALGADNFGQQYTGRLRGTASLLWNNPVGIGDRFILDLASSGKGMTSGTTDYSLPVGYDGWRVGLNYAHLIYTLGKPFSELNSHGIADTLSPYVSYALVRHPESNATLRAGYIERWLSDSALEITSRKREHAGIISISGSRIDQFFGGGVTAYDLSATFGTVSLGASPANSAATAQGSFFKVNGLIQRDQTLAYFSPTRRLSLFLSLRGQMSDTNLTSVEQFSLGGPNGVRAYPVGEAQGDQGAIATAELRYSMDLAPFPGNNLTFSLFRDQGWLQVSKNPWPGFTGPNFRHLGGTGVGLALEKSEKYSLRASVAVRDPGGERDISAKDSHLWMWLQGKIFF